MKKWDLSKWFSLFENPINTFNIELEKQMEIKEKALTLQNCRQAYEFFKLLNEAPENEREKILASIGKRPPMDLLLPLNFSPRIKLQLPDGMPLDKDGAPLYKVDYNTHPDLMQPLATQMGRLKVCLPSHPAKKMDKEKVFLQVLEYIAPREGEVLCACKDKKLQELFPNITPELVGKVFPAYVK